MHCPRLVLAAFLSLAAAAPVYETVVETLVTTVVVDGYATSSAETTTAPTTTEVPTTTEATTAPTTEAPVTTTAPTTTEAPAPTTTSTTAPTTTSSDFQSAILDEHNAKRALHGVPNLSWDSTLEAYAQAYADKYDCSGTLTHSGGPYGENLALGYTVTGTVDAWYAEGANYNYGSSCSVLDHFTQVVWKSSTAVGCAQKQCGSYYGAYVICSYNPPGNYVGECSSEVLPPV